MPVSCCDASAGLTEDPEKANEDGPLFTASKTSLCQNVSYEALGLKLNGTRRAGLDGVQVVLCQAGWCDLMVLLRNSHCLVSQNVFTSWLKLGFIQFICGQMPLLEGLKWYPMRYAFGGGLNQLDSL